MLNILWCHLLWWPSGLGCLWLLHRLLDWGLGHRLYRLLLCRIIQGIVRLSRLLRLLWLVGLLISRSR